jgi:hypothetical protein
MFIVIPLSMEFCILMGLIKPYKFTEWFFPPPFRKDDTMPPGPKVSAMTVLTLLPHGLSRSKVKIRNATRNKESTLQQTL